MAMFDVQDDKNRCDFGKDYDDGDVPFMMTRV